MYFDGELPSPWKEKLEAHLGSCPVCQARFERLRRCSEALRGPASVRESQADLLTAARERVWRRLRFLDRRTCRRKEDPALWGRTVSLPLPALAAAVALLALAFAFALTRRPPPAFPNQDPMAASGTQGIVPVSDMTSVLQYLGNQDSTDIVIIRLPESKNFSCTGEPTILKAADYSRRLDTR
ncbi:MAG: hypothetical protein LBD24_04700 [Spirochaetaceae bacterium]|nr:hypothetical protein [Spirochaetaceae bacterium]